MMKWGKKDSHSSPTYLINHVFPISWLKKLKRKSGSFQPGTKQAKHKVEVNEMSRCSSMPVKWKEGRFYSRADDLYWRLSFGEDSFDEFDGPKTRCKSARTWKGERLRFNVAISERKHVEKKQYKEGKMHEKYQPKRMKAREQRLKALAGYARKDQEQKSLNRHVLKEKKSNFNNRYLKKPEGILPSAHNDLYETKQLKTVKIRDELQKARVPHCRRKWNLLCPSCSANILKENHEFQDSDAEDSNAYPEEEFRKTNEITSRNKHHRLPVHLRRRVHIKRRKANRKTNSPLGRNAFKPEYKLRTTEFTKTEQRVKMEQHDIHLVSEPKTAFDNYAVQKSSYDPQQDFRHSMLEMIIEKEIKQPEELEELLVYFEAAW